MRMKSMHAARCFVPVLFLSAALAALPVPARAQQGASQPGAQPAAVDLSAELLVAIDGERVPRALALLKQGASAGAKDNNGSTALMFAARKAHLAVVEALIRGGADVNARNSSGITP